MSHGSALTTSGLRFFADFTYYCTVVVLLKTVPLLALGVVGRVAVDGLTGSLIKSFVATNCQIASGVMTSVKKSASTDEVERTKISLLSMPSDILVQNQMRNCREQGVLTQIPTAFDPLHIEAFVGNRMMSEMNITPVEQLSNRPSLQPESRGTRGQVRPVMVNVWYSLVVMRRLNERLTDWICAQMCVQSITVAVPLVRDCLRP